MSSFVTYGQKTDTTDAEPVEELSVNEATVGIAKSDVDVPVVNAEKEDPASHKATAKDEEVTPAAPEPEAKAEEVSAFEGFEYTEETLTAETAEEMKDTAVSWTPSLQLN